MPTGSWNCHVHSFDTEKHPLKPTRAYTPQPAKREALLDHALADNIVLVQATVEDGPAGLIDALTQCRSNIGRLVRGTVFADPAPERSLHNLTPDKWQRMHAAGVRSVRIHGAYGGSGSSVDWALDQFIQAAGFEGVGKLGWSISAQLPLQTWSAISDALLTDPRLRDLTIVADHNGSVAPADAGGEHLDRFLRLLRAKEGRFYVKLGALHRRSPGDIRLMRPIIESFARRAPSALLWGSDWPHCDASAAGHEPAPPLHGVDTEGELEMLREWLTNDEWEAMMVANPGRLFGRSRW